GGARESEERPQNQALRPAVARYAGGGPGVATPNAAGSALTMMAAVVLVTLCAWWTRTETPSDRSADRWLTETSAVLILSVLLPPVAWGQHLVVAIPALYVIAARRRAGALGVAATAAMAVYFVLAVLLNREVVGRAASEFLLAHGVHTACMLIVLGV